MSASRTRTPRRIGGMAQAQKTAFGDRLEAARATTVQLAAPLSAEDCALQSMPDASPVKWHLAHTTWFFETFVLERFIRGYRHFDPRYRVLFNSYYNTVGDKHPRPDRGLLSRPTLDEVNAYRRHVEDHLVPLVAQAGDDAELASLLELGLQHEQQHQELILTDLKHLLSRNPLQPVYRERWPLTVVKPRPSRWIGFAGGMVTVGHHGAGFCFDNEQARHEVFLIPFELASHPVTHGDFLAFIDDGGYTRPELWLSLGLDRVQAQRWTAPMYWEWRDGRWTTFTLHGRVEIDPATPMTHVSYFEADAFARWSGKHLPTEMEWEVAARAGGLNDAFGLVWQWTRSSYSPYPGYRAIEGALGEYNGKFMVNQMVLRGSSLATPEGHSRISYRNFFYPHHRWQFTGLRLADYGG